MSNINRFIKSVYLLTILSIYSFFCYLLFKITIQYLPIDTDIAFLSIKQDYVPLLHYRVAFFIHVFSSIFVLLAGYTQFSRFIFQKRPKVHRKMGWIYVILTLLLAGPSGFIIGIYANGGWSSQLAFCLLAVLWMYFTFKAIWSIRFKNIVKHKEWMIRSFSLALSAITLRAWKYLIVATFHTRPMDTYVIVAWLGWVLNLLIAELIIYRIKKK